VGISVQGTKCGPSLGFYDVSQISHHSFLMGDLNFRTDFTIGGGGGGDDDIENVVVELLEADETKPQTGDADDKERIHREKFEKAMAFIDEEDYAGLLKFDELEKMLREGDGMIGWNSLLPTFRPTFKVIKNKPTTEYVAGESEKMRSEATRLLLRIVAERPTRSHEERSDDYYCC